MLVDKESYLNHLFVFFCSFLIAQQKGWIFPLPPAPPFLVRTNHFFELLFSFKNFNYSFEISPCFHTTPITLITPLRSDVCRLT